MIWLIVFAVITVAATVSAAYVLTLLDQIVHSQLYNYGLQFSLEWANPYWTLLRILLALLGIIVTFTAVSAIFTFRKYMYAKTPDVKAAPSQKTTITFRPPQTRVAEKVSTSPPTPSATPAHPPVPSEPAPTPTPESASSEESSEIPGLIKCFHCGKAFTQPLRMLDFQGDRPRIVNICPFCNEIIPTAPRRDLKEQNKRFLFGKKNNNHVPKTLPSQATS